MQKLNINRPVNCYNDNEMVKLGLRHSKLEPVERMSTPFNLKKDLKKLKSAHKAIEKMSGKLNSFTEQNEMLACISRHVRNKIRFNGTLIIS